MGGVLGRLQNMPEYVVLSFRCSLFSPALMPSHRKMEFIFSSFSPHRAQAASKYGNECNFASCLQSSPLQDTVAPLLFSGVLSSPR